MITDCFDDKTEPVISLRDFYGEQKHLIETCLILFSQKIYQHLLDTYPSEKIGLIGACNGNIPIYRMNYKGKDIAFYLSGIGSAIAASWCYEASWIVGASKFGMFGSCGSLNREATRGKFIVPTESCRGEGCSYYFAAPSDYITVENARKLSAIFTELGVPHSTGRVWTTDAMIRETAGLVAQRRSEGCLAVEMELAGVQAVCSFYGLSLYNFLEAGDVLAESGYDVANLRGANHDLGKPYNAPETATRPRLASKPPRQKSRRLLFAVFLPFTNGIAKTCSQKSAYTLSICSVLSFASSAVAWKVCPSCHKNSEERRNGRVVFSQRSTEHH